MYDYIRKLTSMGFNTYLTYGIIHYFDYDSNKLDEFILFLEGDKLCHQYGKNSITILLVEEESGIVPSER